jgi:prepilin-type processing-associated H-X9-DG protein
MVVLAVLAVLASLFLPALARESARDSRAFCLHRLGQLARAMAMYAVEAEDWLPPNPDDGNTTPYHNWCGGQAGAGQSQEFNPDILRDPTRALLTPYLGGNISYYRCPADLRTGRYQGTDLQRRGQIIPSARTVSLNQAVGSNPSRAGGKAPVDGPWLDAIHAHTANHTWYCYGRMSDFVRPGPARTFTFIEEDARSLNDAAFGISGPRTPPFYFMLDWPATYHEVAGGVAFADGHAEIHRWVDNRTPVPKSGVSQATHPNNPDLVWLTERASALVVKP